MALGLSYARVVGLARRQKRAGKGGRRSSVSVAGNSSTRYCLADWSSGLLID